MNRLEARARLSESRHQHSNGVAGFIGWMMRVLLFSVLAIFEPLARLSSVVAMLAVICAGLYALAGTRSAPIFELLVAAIICAVIPVLYYLLMRFLRP